MMGHGRDGRIVRRTESALDAWLDGTGTERAARRSGETGAQEVELWKRLQADAARLRRVRAPADLCARIMVALPPEAPQPAAPPETRARR